MINKRRIWVFGFALTLGLGWIWGRQTAPLLTREEQLVVSAVELATQATVLVRAPGELGSGVVIDKEGWVVTNFHVVKGAGMRGEVALYFHGDPARYSAKVWGTAPALDLALLKVSAPASQLYPLEHVALSKVIVGQKVLAIGSPAGLDFTVSEGVVSSVRIPYLHARRVSLFGTFGRYITEVIQTTAPINPGNSGGPLVDLQGRLLGINTATMRVELLPSTSFGATLTLGQELTPQELVNQAAKEVANRLVVYEGLNFAVPAETVFYYLPDLKAGLELTAERLEAMRPRLGAKYLPTGLYPRSVRKKFALPEDGLMVWRLLKGSPAEEAGLVAAKKTIAVEAGQLPKMLRFRLDPAGKHAKVELPVDGDVLVEAEGKPLFDEAQLRAIIWRKRPGEGVRLRIWRPGEGRFWMTVAVPKIIPNLPF